MNPRSKLPKYHVPLDLWNLAKEGMKRSLEAMELEFSNSSVRLTGDLVLEAHSRADYQKHFRGLTKYCCLLVTMTVY
jgi:hypothetical protein